MRKTFIAIIIDMQILFFNTYYETIILSDHDTVQ